MRAPSAFAASLLVLELALAAPLAANAPYGYLANAGWIDFAPSASTRVSASDTHLQGLAYAANFGWIDLGDGSPANGVAYANNSATDFGVNHNGRGELSGYAYGANIGWINFSWAGANDPNRPRVDLVTGIASGFAYSANVGWIDLSALTMPGVTASVRFPSGSPTQTAGGSLTLSAGAFGNEALTFQWLFKGVPIPGATGASFTLPSAQAFHAGEYSVIITRTDGSTFTVAPGTLAIAAPAPNNARLLNLSTRGLAQADANQLFPGFVVSGPGTKKLLIRAVGPSLAALGFTSPVIPDPRMELKKFNFVTQLYEDYHANDDWQTNANAADIATTSATLGAFALTDTSDAALLVDLPAGQYAVVGGDKNGTSGIGMVELYDADPSTGSGQVPASSLINISNRGFCGIGDEVMIPGFVVSSEGPKTLLVRVVGPTIGSAPYHVPGAMTDPKLSLYQHDFTTNTDNLLLTQDDWGDNADAATTAQIATQVSAFPLAPGSGDAAFVVTLQPGVYTVVGSSAIAGATGVVLVEVYAVP